MISRPLQTAFARTCLFLRRSTVFKKYFSLMSSFKKRKQNKTKATNQDNPNFNVKPNITKASQSELKQTHVQVPKQVLNVF